LAISPPRPCSGEFTALDPQLDISGPTSKGREGMKEGKGGDEGRAKEGRRDGRGPTSKARGLGGRQERGGNGVKGRGGVKGHGRGVLAPKPKNQTSPMVVR